MAKKKGKTGRRTPTAAQKAAIKKAADKAKEQRRKLALARRDAASRLLEQRADRWIPTGKPRAAPKQSRKGRPGGPRGHALHRGAPTPADESKDRTQRVTPGFIVGRTPSGPVHPLNRRLRAARRDGIATGQRNMSAGSPPPVSSARKMRFAPETKEPGVPDNPSGPRPKTGRRTSTAAQRAAIKKAADKKKAARRSKALAPTRKVGRRRTGY